MNKKLSKRKVPKKEMPEMIGKRVRLPIDYINLFFNETRHCIKTIQNCRESFIEFVDTKLNDELGNQMMIHIKQLAYVNTLNDFEIIDHNIYVNTRAYYLQQKKIIDDLEKRYGWGG